MSLTVENKRVEINVRWARALHPKNGMRIAYVQGEQQPRPGMVMHVFVSPSNQCRGIFKIDWIKDDENRICGIESVSLTRNAERAGSFLLEVAYAEEDWPEGWKAYSAWLEQTEPQGGRKALAQGRPFPASGLPKVVQALQKIDEGKPAIWDTGIPVHPADAPKSRAKGKQAEAVA